MKVNKELLKGTTTLFVLQLLEDGDKYGYEMTRELEARSESLFQLKEGTLYPILHALENKNYIESYWEDTKLDRKRKYYRITEEGRKELKNKKQEWFTYAKGVNQVLGGGVTSESLCF